MINEIIESIFNDCKRKENKLGISFFDEHLKIVCHYALKLGEYFDADEEIIKLSSYLHDISVVYDFNTLAEHNIISSDIAVKKLIEYNYDKVKIKEVEKCIKSHKEPVQINNGSSEEICLSNADGMAFIFRFASLNIL